MSISYPTNRKLIAFLISMFVVGFSVSKAAFDLRHPGFEGSWQNGWAVSGSDGGMSTVQAAASRSGAVGLRVTDASTSAGSNLYSTPHPARSGKKYTVRFWWRAVSGSGVAVYLVFYDNQGNSLNSSALGNENFVSLASTTTFWSPQMLTATAPANATSVRIRVHSFNGSLVVADLDDFSLHEEQYNMLSNANPGFEGSITPWTGTDSMSSVQSVAKRSGSSGLRVVDSSTTSGSSLWSAPVNVSANSVYVLRFWAKLVSGSGMGVYIVFYDEAGTRLNTSQLGNEIYMSIPSSASDWREFHLEALSPSNAATAKVWLHSFQGSLVTAYLDDLYFTRGQGPDETRVQQISDWLPSTARGVGRPISDRSAWTALPESIKTVMTNAGNNRLTESLPALTDSLYLQFSQNGNRSNFETPYRARINFLTDLVLAECVNNNGSYLAKIEAVLNGNSNTWSGILNERCWTLPAHDRDLYCFNNHYKIVDLGATDRAWALATVDYLLGSKLASSTRTRIRNEVEGRVLFPFVNFISGRTERAGVWWHTSNSNWNAVCHASIVGAALALMDDKRERAWIVAAMEMNCPFYYISGFPSDGYCSEGVSYWNYGFGRFMALSETVGAATGWNLNLLTPGVVEKVLLYPRRMELLPGVYPAIGDSGTSSGPENWIHRLGGRRLVEMGRTAVVSGHGRPSLATNMRYPIYRGMIIAFANQMNNPSALMSAATGTTFADPLPLRDHFHVSGIYIARHNPSTTNGFSIAIKAGHNAELHNHNDVGSYTVAYKGKTPLVDPGSEIYTSRTFSDHRYDSKLINSFGHAVPVVAGTVTGGIVRGKLQNQGGSAAATMTIVSTSSSEDVITLNLKSAYSGTVPQLNTLTRTMRFTRAATPSIQITDSATFSSSQTFGTALVTFSDAVTTSGTNSLLIPQDTATLGVTVSASHGLRTFQIEDLNDDTTTTGVVEGGDPLTQKTGLVARRINLDLNTAVTTGQVSYTITPAN